MFCPYCGANLVDKSYFCMNCGKKIITSLENTETLSSNSNVVDPLIQQYQAQKNATRKSELASLIAAISHFSQKANQFQEYDDVCNRVNYYSRGARNSLLIWGCIITTFALIMSLPLIGSNDPSASILLLFFVPGPLMIVGGILMKVNNIKKNSYYKERYAKLSKELYNHYLTYPHCPVGPEYANPKILNLFLNVLQSGRADTIKESINLVIDTHHKKQVRKYLAAIERNTAEINATTKVPTFFIAASFFI